jgi:hypothetical protein
VPRKDTKRGRFYEFRGKGPFPSVTTLLSVINKPALIGWAAKLERFLVVQEAAELYQELGQMLATPLAKDDFKRHLEERLGKAKAHQRVMPGKPRTSAPRFTSGSSGSSERNWGSTRRMPSSRPWCMRKPRRASASGATGERRSR